MRKFNFILAFCVVFLLAAVSVGWAFGEIRYPDRPLNLRKGRSAKTTWVGSLYPGQKVRIAHLKDGWVAVYEPKATNSRESAAVGYSNVKYLKKKRTRHEPKAWGQMMYTPRTLNVRNKPSVKGKRLDTLKANEHVIVDFPEDDWVMVFWPSATIRSELNARGFSSGKYFKPATQKSLKRAGLVQEQKPAPTPAVKNAPVPVAVSEPVNVGSGQGQVGGTVAPPPPMAPAKTLTSDTPKGGERWGTVLTVPQKVNLRVARTTSSKYVRTLKPGEKVRVDFLKSGWYAVFHENELVRSEKRAMGYALQSLLEGGEKIVTPPVASAPPTPAPASVASATIAAPVQKKSPAAKKASAETKTFVIDRTKFSGAKRPDPTPDKTAHGYKYRVIEKSETKRLGETWITIKVFLAATKLPGTNALKDFSTTIWREHQRANKNVAVLIYMPGMDLEDLAYGVTKFDDTKMLELWVRKATLFGTDFL